MYRNYARLADRNYARLTTLSAPKLTLVGGDLKVRAHPRPCSADRARSRAHRAEPSLLLSWRVRQVHENPELTALKLPMLTAVAGDLWVRALVRRSADRARAAARIAPSLPCR